MALTSDVFPLSATGSGPPSSALPTPVTIALPRTEEGLKADDAPTLSPAGVSGSGRTVLVVEDEPAVRQVMIDALEDAGFETLEACDGPSGLAVLWSDAEIDLLVSDVGLPGMNGRQLADAGRRTRHDLKVLFVTGYAYDKAAGDSLLAEGSDVLTKPFANVKLIDRVRSLLS